jgi:hypothetical protein
MLVTNYEYAKLLGVRKPLQSHVTAGEPRLGPGSDGYRWVEYLGDYDPLKGAILQQA